MLIRITVVDGRFSSAPSWVGELGDAPVTYLCPEGVVNDRTTARAAGYRGQISDLIAQHPIIEIGSGTGEEWGIRVERVEVAPDTELVREILAKHGSDNQRAKLAAGLLDLAEVLTMARCELFAPFDWYPRWAKSRAVSQLIMALRHVERDGWRPDCKKRHVITDQALGQLGPGEQMTFAAIARTADEVARHPWLADTAMAVSVTGSSLWVGCTCGASERRRRARVVIRFLGRDLVREYAL